MVGKPPHPSLNDHKRLRCSARSFRALGVQRLLRSTFSHRGSMQACGLPRNTRSHNPAKRTILTSDTASFRRPLACTTALRKARRKKRAVSNVKKRGRFACKPATGARFSETPNVSRVFSPCLTFWYFWVKPKVRRKNVADFRLRKLRQLAPHGPKPPFAEARHKGASSAGFDPHFLQNLFLLFLSKKEPKKTARRKWSGIRRTPR